MKPLNTIQTFAKIGKVLSKIVFIFCIVGFVGCIAGIIGLAVGGEEVLHIGDLTIQGLIEKGADISVATFYASMAVGIVFCVAEAVLSKFAEKYFKNELADGTPFTFRGSKELKRLGILTIAIPLGAISICSIGVAIAGHFFTGIKDVSFSDYASVGLGIGMILMSLVCRHGAEIAEVKEGELEA